MYKGDTSSFGGTLVVIGQTLESYGVNAEEVFQQAGIEFQKAIKPDSRISIKAMLRLIEVVKEKSGDPCFGLKFAEFVHPTSYHALGLALLSSSNLRSFFKRLERYFSFITTNEIVLFQEEEDSCNLTVQAVTEMGSNEINRIFLDGTIAFVLKLIRLMYRPDYAPVSVDIPHTPTEQEAALYQNFFKAPIQFSAATYTLYLNPADLDRPLPAANSEFAIQNDQVVANYLNQMEHTNLISKVRSKLIEYLPAGDCSKEKVARALNMSVRSLHKRLNELGTNYQETLDNTRQELAEQYMQQATMSVSEIGYLLGFSDCSNFSRAFKHWTGLAPSAYRQKYSPSDPVLET